jgi:flagellar motor switch protein FliN/FliY
MAIETILPTAALPAFANERRAAGKPLFTLEGLSDVALRVEVPLGVVETTLGELLALTPGAVLMLDRLTGESLPLTAHGTAIARGEIRVHGERFAVRITEICGRNGRPRTGGPEPHAKPPSHA